MLCSTPPTPPGIEMCQHVTPYAPLSYRVKQPHSRATTTSITVSVANNTTTSSSNITRITSNTNTNMIYVLRYKSSRFRRGLMYSLAFSGNQQYQRVQVIVMCIKFADLDENTNPIC